MIYCGNLIDGTGNPAINDAVIVIEGSRISDVGIKSETDIPNDAYVIDATGKTVVPGFIDSHTHFLSMGFRLGHLQLSDAESIDDVVERLKTYISSKGLQKEKWVQGRGWDDQNLNEKRYPNRHDLDEVSPDNPTALTRVCGHMIVLNSKALEYCQINRDTPNPEGGLIDKDEYGEPTGILRDARSLVSPNIPPPTYEALRQGLRDAIELAHSLGVTTIHDPSRPDEKAMHSSTTPYVDAHKESDLRIRAHVMTGYPREWSGDEWLTFGTLKIGIDGSLGAQTALLYEPYANDPSTKGVYVGDKKLNNSRAKEADEKNGQIAIHAIGDRAIKEAVDLIEEVIKENPREDHRYRIEHYEYPTDEDIERTVNLGIIPSMQPNFVGEWGWPEGMYETRLGNDRNKRSNPYKRLIEKGLHVVFGSDGMPFHPLYGVWSAVNHPNPTSRISIEEAIRSYTLEGAYATREEHLKGSIEVGKLADVAILPMDITNSEFCLKTTDSDTVEKSKKEMKKNKVHLTIINGEIVFQT